MKICQIQYQDIFMLKSEQNENGEILNPVLSLWFFIKFTTP